MFSEKINAGFKQLEFMICFYKKCKRLKDVFPIPYPPVDAEIFADHFTARRRYRVEQRGGGPDHMKAVRQKPPYLIRVFAPAPRRPILARVSEINVQ